MKRTYTYLADRTGLSISHVSRIMKGEREGSLLALRHLAREYEVSVDGLLEMIARNRKRWKRVKRVRKLKAQAKAEE